MDSVGGEVEVTTSGGDITIGNINDRLKATTAGGDIELGNVGGNAEIKTIASGDPLVNFDSRFLYKRT